MSNLWDDWLCTALDLNPRAFATLKPKPETLFSLVQKPSKSPKPRFNSIKVRLEAWTARYGRVPTSSLWDYSVFCCSCVLNHCALAMINPSINTCRLPLNAYLTQLELIFPAKRIIPEEQSMHGGWVNGQPVGCLIFCCSGVESSCVGPAEALPHARPVLIKNIEGRLSVNRLCLSFSRLAVLVGMLPRRFVGLHAVVWRARGCVMAATRGGA